MRSVSVGTGSLPTCVSSAVWKELLDRLPLFVRQYSAGVVTCGGHDSCIVMCGLLVSRHGGSGQFVANIFFDA